MNRGTFSSQDFLYFVFYTACAFPLESAVSSVTYNELWYPYCSRSFSTPCLCVHTFLGVLCIYEKNIWMQTSYNVESLLITMAVTLLPAQFYNQHFPPKGRHMTSRTLSGDIWMIPKATWLFLQEVPPSARLTPVLLPTRPCHRRSGELIHRWWQFTIELTADQKVRTSLWP